MISIVIPALDEARALPATLAAVSAQAGAFEVIVVDGGSKDATRDIAAAVPGVRVLRAPRGRARQMNCGAAQARGATLLFLHADTWLPADALVQIEAALRERVCGAGGFSHRFSGDDWRLRLISAIDNWRTRRTRIVYGDQALFVRRDLFMAIGGFDEVAALEDVRICERLRGLTEVRILPAHVVTDGRKFLAMGPWKSLARVAHILVRHRLGLAPPPSPFFTDIR